MNRAVWQEAPKETSEGEVAPGKRCPGAQELK